MELRSPSGSARHKINISSWAVLGLLLSGSVLLGALRTLEGRGQLGQRQATLYLSHPLPTSSLGLPASFLQAFELVRLLKESVCSS